MSTPNPVPPTIVGAVKADATALQAKVNAEISKAEDEVISITHARWAAVIAALIGVVAGILLKAVL